MKSFLMIGQSNMAGRGDFGDVPEIKNPHCFMLRNGNWMPMSEPVNPDRAVFGSLHSGVGLAASFADEYAKYYNEDIGLIPCAHGGTKLEQWMPGEILYDNAVMNAKLAQRTSEIFGILWHQGESDSKSEENKNLYHDRFIAVISSIKKDLDLPDDIPLLVGGLGDFIKTYKDGACLYYDDINEILAGFEAEIRNCGFVSAEGLECKADGVHFNSKSCREFGKRYFDVYLKIRSGTIVRHITSLDIPAGERRD